MTRVAAAIVTHNSAAWLPATLASVLSQSRPPDRVVVVDDASTDATVAILRDHGIDVLASRSRRARDVLQPSWQERSPPFADVPWVSFVRPFDFRWQD